MPSLHFGYALIVGVVLAVVAQGRAWRIAGALYPAAMLLIIVATGNRFFVDAALGVVVVIGWLIARAVIGVARPAPALAPRRHVRLRLTANPPPPCAESRPAVRGASRDQHAVHLTDTEAGRCEPAKRTALKEATECHP